MPSPKKATLLWAAAFTATVSPQHIFAQETQFGDIVTVYDTRRAARALPLSVDVLDQNTLKTKNIVHPAEILNQVAGVNIHRGSGQEHLTAIRSPVLTGGAGAGSFLYLQDGVPLRAAGFANVNGLFEAGTEFAGSLDVIKGPGPATYGSNAVHGLINVQSAAPAADTDRVSVMSNTDGLISLSASHGLPVDTGTSVAQGSISLVSDPGFRAASGFDQQKFQLRLDHDFAGPWKAETLAQFQNLNQETAGFIQGPEAYKDDAIRFTNPNPEAFRDAKSYRMQARFEREINGNTAAITPYARRAELRFLRHFVPGQALEKNAHSSIGLQTAYYNPEGRFNVGFDTEYTKGSLYEFQQNPSRFSFVQGLHFDYDVTAIVAAAYGETSLSLNDRLTVELGLRGEFTQYDYDNNASPGSSGRFIRAADRQDDFLTVTPKITLAYQANEQIYLYMRGARGSRAPQVTDLYSAQQNQIPGQADVETLDSLETGLKYSNANVSLELAAFIMQKDNFFFRNANGFNVVNGKTRHTGMEASFEWAVTSWFSLSGDGTYARHTYDFTEITGSPANNILDGNRVDTAPDTLGNIRASFTPIPRLETEIEWRHVGGYFTNPGNTAKYPGHDIFVLRAAFELSNQTTLFARIDNLIDLKYADRADFAFGNERYFPGRPRTLFAGIRAEF